MKSAAITKVELLAHIGRKHDAISAANRGIDCSQSKEEKIALLQRKATILGDMGRHIDAETVRNDLRREFPTENLEFFTE